MWWPLPGVCPEGGQGALVFAGSSACSLNTPLFSKGCVVKVLSCSLQLNEVFKHIPGCHKLQQTKFR